MAVNTGENGDWRLKFNSNYLNILIRGLIKNNIERVDVLTTYMSDDNWKEVNSRRGH